MGKKAQTLCLRSLPKLRLVPEDGWELEIDSIYFYFILKKLFHLREVFTEWWLAFYGYKYIIDGRKAIMLFLISTASSLSVSIRICFFHTCLSTCSFLGRLSRSKTIVWTFWTLVVLLLIDGIYLSRCRTWWSDSGLKQIV